MSDNIEPIYKILRKAFGQFSLIRLFPDVPVILTEICEISLTAVKFPKTALFSRQVVTLWTSCTNMKHYFVVCQVDDWDDSENTFLVFIIIIIIIILLLSKLCLLATTIHDRRKTIRDCIMAKNPHRLLYRTPSGKASESMGGQERGEMGYLTFDSGCWDSFHLLPHNNDKGMMGREQLI